MIGVMKLGKGIVMRGTIDPHIVNSNFFQRLQIIVNDHPPRPDNGHLPNLARLQPTTLDSREFLVTEGKRKICDVFNSRGYVRVALAVHCQWQFAKNMQDDGNIVRCQVPNDVDVLLK